MKSVVSKRALAALGACFLQVAGAFGAITISSPAGLTNVSVADATKITLSVTATTGAGTQLQYYWRKVGVGTPLKQGTMNSGATNQFVIASSKPTDAGTYFVSLVETGVANPDSLNSPNFEVMVTTRPKITVHPVAPAAIPLQGSTVTFNVGLDPNIGDQPFTYNWQKKSGASFVDMGVETANTNDRTDVLTLNNVQASSAGSYRVRVNNGSGITVYSKEAVLKVNSRPTIAIAPPVAFNVAYGGSGVLKVVAGGTPPFFYQWVKGAASTPILKSNTPNLTIKGLDPADANVAGGPGEYKVRIINKFNTGFPPDGKDPFNVPGIEFTESINPTIVRVIRKPKILTQPAIALTVKNTINIMDGMNPVPAGPHTLSVGMDTQGDEGTLTYQWYKDNKIMVGQTGSTLTLGGASATWNDRGSYKVVVKNEVGSVTSASAVVTIVSPPIITSQSPPDIFAPLKGSAKLFVVATGTTPVTYEWRFLPIAEGEGQTDEQKLALIAAKTTLVGKAATLTVSAFSNANHQGYYQCTVKNAPKINNVPTVPGSALSGLIYVQGDDAPKITQQTTVLPYVGAPGGKATPKIPLNKDLRLRVKLTGTDRLADQPGTPGTLKANAFTVRWLRNGLPFLPMAGATATTSYDVPTKVTTLDLVIDSAVAGDTGKYSAEITNFLGKVTSTALAITVAGPPIITVQPQDATGIEEALIETSLTATGGSPALKYQWQKSIVGSWVNQAGKTSAKLTFNPSAAGHDGMYRCLVKNDFTPTDADAAVSNEVRIKVDPIPDPAPGGVVGLSTVEFYPNVARTDEKVRIFGTNMNYTESVKFGTANAAFVLESPNSLLVTVPPAAPTAATPISIKNRKNINVIDTIATFRRSALFENYLVPASLSQNAPTIIALASGSVQLNGNSDEVGFVGYELNIPRQSQVDITLLSDTDPQSGLLSDPDMTLYIDTSTVANSWFGPAGVLRYPTNPPAAQRAFNLGNDFLRTNTTKANQRLLVGIEPGLTGLGWVGTGPFIIVVSVTPLNITSNVSGQSGEIGGNWVGNGSEKDAAADATAAPASDSDSIQLGGKTETGTGPVVLWRQLDSTPSQGTVVSSFNMSLESGDAGGDDQFAWQVSQPDGSPLMSLWLNAEDGSLRAVQPDGTVTTSIQHIVAGGGAHRFEVTVNLEDDTWITLMDGVPVTDPIKLPEGALFGDISAVWDLGADKRASGAYINFSDFRVEGMVAP